MGRKKSNPIEMFSSDEDILSVFDIIHEAVFLKRSKFSGLCQGGFKSYTSFIVLFAGRGKIHVYIYMCI